MIHKERGEINFRNGGGEKLIRRKSFQSGGREVATVKIHYGSPE